MSYTIEEALRLAKDFTAPRRKGIQDALRPALRGASVDENYVWATDGTWLIRIKHNEINDTSYIFGYTPEDTRYFSSGNAIYPACQNLIPERSTATCILTIEKIHDWLNAHEQVCVMKHNQFHTTLNTYEKTIKAKSMEKGIFGNSMTFIYRNLPFEMTGDDSKLYYDASKMVKILKMLQKLRSEIKFYIFGARRPFVLEAEDILILVLPFSFEYSPVPEKPKKEPKPPKPPKPKKEPKPKKKTKTKSKAKKVKK